ncbi:MAG: hypothetical protein EAZ92_13715 [Candidatus Kapaibacterium sp.]|nr:MAG: hypothetical protein EAZ92_13715 [Candidatus Kapabacteria bacterium]
MDCASPTKHQYIPLIQGEKNIASHVPIPPQSCFGKADISYDLPSEQVSKENAGMLLGGVE